MAAMARAAGRRRARCSASSSARWRASTRPWKSASGVVQGASRASCRRPLSSVCRRAVSKAPSASPSMSRAPAGRRTRRRAATRCPRCSPRRCWRARSTRRASDKLGRVGRLADPSGAVMTDACAAAAALQADGARPARKAAAGRGGQRAGASDRTPAPSRRRGGSRAVGSARARRSRPGRAGAAAARAACARRRRCRPRRSPTFARAARRSARARIMRASAATGVNVPRVSVEAVLPADVVGLFVLVPAGV